MHYPPFTHLKNRVTATHTDCRQGRRRRSRVNKRHIWKPLNKRRTGVGRCKVNMKNRMTIKKTYVYARTVVLKTDLVRNQPEGFWRFWVETAQNTDNQSWRYRIIPRFIFTQRRLCSFYFLLFEFHRESVFFEQSSDTKKTEGIIYNYIKHHEICA